MTKPRPISSEFEPYLRYYGNQFVKFAKPVLDRIVRAMKRLASSKEWEMSGIPKDAREFYCNKKGEPIAWCPVDSLGITDIEREQFYRLNKDRLMQLAVRARQRTSEMGEEQCVVCIDVDDPRWTPLVDMLMPGHDWDSYRARGEKPVARGVVPCEPIESVVEDMYPAAGKFHTNGITNVVVFAAGGATIIGDAGGA